MELQRILILDERLGLRFWLFEIDYGWLKMASGGIRRFGDLEVSIMLASFR